MDLDGIFQRQQLGAVLAPLAGDHGTHVKVVIEPGGGQIILGMDAVEVKMREGPRAAVIVDDGKGRAGHRVGAAKPLGNALTERGFARAQPAGERDQRARGQCPGKRAAGGNGFLPRMGHKFLHRYAPCLRPNKAMATLIYIIVQKSRFVKFNL